MKPDGKHRLVMVVAVLLCFVSMLGSNLIMNDFGKVAITNISTKTEIGTLTGYLYAHKNVSADAKAPAIVVSHGYSGSSEFVDSWAIELARRGYVVFSPNLYGHGDSSVADAGYADTVAYQSNGLYDAVEYLYTIDYVDTKRIGVTGHSLGGGSSITTATYYSGLEKAALSAGVSPEEAHKLNKVAACLSVSIR